MHLRRRPNEQVEIETFVSAEQAGALNLPAVAQVRFSGACHGLLPAVSGRLVRSSQKDEDNCDPDSVRMRIEISFDTLRSLAPYFTPADQKAANELMTMPAGAHVVLGQVMSFAEASEAAGIAPEGRT